MKLLFTNNARKMAGLALRRKRDKRRRTYTRNKPSECLAALMDVWEEGQ